MENKEVEQDSCCCLPKPWCSATSTSPSSRCMAIHSSCTSRSSPTPAPPCKGVHSCKSHSSCNSPSSLANVRVILIRFDEWHNFFFIKCRVIFFYVSALNYAQEQIVLWNLFQNVRILRSFTSLPIGMTFTMSVPIGGLHVHVDILLLQLLFYTYN